MKILPPRIYLMALLSFLALGRIAAQNPTVTAQVDYPVGVSSVQLAYGGSKYVLLGGYNSTASLNALYQSSSGTSWRTVVPVNLATTPLNHIVFGAGLFVVVGNGGVIQTSADGILWTTRSSGTTSNLFKAYFINGRFFAIGYAQTVVTSTDGINWSAIAFNGGNAADFFMSLAYGNGVYVLAARRDNGPQNIVYRSTTAASNSWTVTNNALGLGESVNRIQFLKDKFFAYNIGQRMYNSSDGLTWTEFTNSVMLTNPDGNTTPWNNGHQIFHGVWDGTKYSFYGCSAYYGGYGSTFTSTDGRNFTLLNKTAYIVPQESSIINGIYFVCGNEGIVTSTDGVNYTHPGSSYRDVVKTANKYVAVAMTGADGRFIANSPDFSNWTPRGPKSIRELYATAYDGTNVLACGYQYILRSADEGDSWTVIANNSTTTFSALAFGGGRFVIGGYDASVPSGTSGAFLRYSTDAGQNWVTANTDNNFYFKIKYVNNHFFALGYDNANFLGKIMYSADGTSWTDVTPNLGFEALYFKDVAFDGSKYHFFGVESSNYTPVQFFSVSTGTPEAAASYGNKAVINNVPAGAVLGGAYDEGVLEYAAGRFTGAVIDVNTGQDYIITSRDGSSWTALPQASYSAITASSVSGNTVRMLGRGNAFFTVNYAAVLPVSLLGFEGRLAKGEAQLNWATASEQNSKQFLVQHSTSGAAWTTVGIVPAGNMQGKPYGFVHPNPVNGLNFYRLLMQDADGRTTQSKVITLATGEGKAALSLYPNPATDRLVVRTASGKLGQLVLYNGAGQVVKSTALTGNLTVVNLAGLPGGIYQAEITQGEERRQVTMVKN